MKLSALGEFGLIRRFSPPFLEHLAREITGIGDDCAVLPWKDDRSLLVTTDMLVEDIHFLRRKIPPRDLGYKSLAVNLSDIAAMGGTPESAYLSLGLPGELDIQWIDDFFAGLRELGERENVSLLGGDTTKSPSIVIINLAVIGTVAATAVKYRSTARPGDVVCVTGFVGDSGGGLGILLEDRPMDEDATYLVRQHHRPRAHLAEGRWLAARKGVHAMMDVSDGIDSDLRRIMERSHCAAALQIERLPISGQLERTAARYGWNPLDLAVAGGEDYCLLVTVDPDSIEETAAAFQAEFDSPLHRIGTITAQADELTYFKGTQRVELGKHGFDHFAG
jgi:thiamine-monophosphate kinase